MMQMPGQMRPDMPNIPQIKPAGMRQAAALPSEVEQLKRLPRAQLMQALMSPGERPPKWALVTALDQQAKENQMRQAQAGAAAQRQVAGLGTVVQDVATRRLARGGVVGFDEGGKTEAKDPIAAAYEREQLETSGMSEPDPAAGSTWDFLRRLAATGSRARAENLRLQEEAARQEEEENRRRAEEEARRAAAALATGPFLTIPPYLAAAGSAGGTPPTAPASAAPANRRGLGTGTPSRTPPPADTTPAAQQAPGFDLKALQDAIRKAGEVSPDVQEARDALRTQRQASLSARERRRAGLEAEMSEKPSMGLAALRIARAAGSAKNLPEFFSLGSGAVADLQTEETKRLRELRRELMTMEDAEDNLREAMAEKTLAERSGDDAARKAANVKLLEAQRDYLDKQRTLDIQAQEARARTTAAERSGSGNAPGERVGVTALTNLIRSLQEVVDNPLASPAEQESARIEIKTAQRALAALGGMPVAASSAPPPGAVRVKGQ